jgi:putative nucleotidyltransferase with HDIG domain
MNYKNIEHIAAGQLKAGKSKKDLYQAHLGTCVGLALYDKRSKVGGMIHLLLPEPPTYSSSLSPEKYASTGVPELLKELIKLGASPSHIKASIAGGALVGPVSQQDINLDIGGRTTEIALTILKTAGIQTVKSETGGFFTCTLELNMATGDTQIRPAWDADSQLTESFSPPSIDDILNIIEQLKPIPQTALKIMRIFQSGRGNIDDIAQELSKDQVLSGQTIKICNSVLFSGTIPIESLQDAVVLMGEDMLVKSVITAAVNHYYQQTGNSGYSLCKGGLFFHAIGVAILAEKIAAASTTVNPKQAYTAGLLHDIGKVVLDQYVADNAPLFFRSIQQEDQSFLQSEKQLIGITHCEAGAMLAKRWKFSERLTATIRYHHQPTETPDHRDLVYIVYLADLLLEKFSVGLDLEKMQTNSLQPVLDHLQIKPEDLLKLVDSIPFDAFNTNEL